MVHVAQSRSISLHRAPIASEVRAALRTRKRSAIPAPSRLACAAVSILATTCATSPTATDSRCFVLCPEWGRMASMAPLAGLSVRCPCAMHQSSTSRRRWRTLRAVGALPARSSAATMPTTSSHTMASTDRSATGSRLRTPAGPAPARCLDACSGSMPPLHRWFTQRDRGRSAGEPVRAPLRPAAPEDSVESSYLHTPPVHSTAAASKNQQPTPFTRIRRGGGRE